MILCNLLRTGFWKNAPRRSVYWSLRSHCRWIVTGFNVQTPILFVLFLVLLNTYSRSSDRETEVPSEAQSTNTSSLKSRLGILCSEEAKDLHSCVQCQGVIQSARLFLIRENIYKLEKAMLATAKTVDMELPFWRFSIHVLEGLWEGPSHHNCGGQNYGSSKVP